MRRYAFTLIELLTVLAIMSIIASMLLPSLSRAREMGRRTACLSNLRQIGLAAQLYADDNDDGFLPCYAMMSEEYEAPPSCPHTRYFIGWWGEILQPYAKSTQIFVCPSAPNTIKLSDPQYVVKDDCPGMGSGKVPRFPGLPSFCPPPPPRIPKPQFYSYAFNAISEYDRYWTHSPSLPKERHGFSQHDTEETCVVSRFAEPILFLEVQQPAETIWLTDAELSDGTLPRPELFEDDHLDYPDHLNSPNIEARRVSQRHHGAFNALFADGHVKWEFNSKPSQWTVQND